ncbi:DUF3306 domain-containing protein [Jannaschia marina]|uniref:DUF3306 domain-containing protein n=1 Tax=Jannaschia marina TaxID=2741674 RepID=UPI0015C92644|nr:DUF3306 domain-containing protein [Jannaschia marina]
MSDFWSRRRKAVEAEESAEAARVEAEAKTQEDAARAAAQAEMSEADLLDSLNLPDPDSVSGDDIAAFMAREVPKHLRNRALRSLWRSNPVLACVDGLNDYDGDFTGDGLNGGVLKTSYEVGKGLAAHVRKLAEAEASQDDQADDDRSERVASEPAVHPLEEKTLAPQAPVVEVSDREPAAEEAAIPEAGPPRRMRFTFEEEDDRE